MKGRENMRMTIEIFNDFSFLNLFFDHLVIGFLVIYFLEKDKVKVNSDRFRFFIDQ